MRKIELREETYPRKWVSKMGFPELKLEPPQVLITEQEILADLRYPAATNVADEGKQQR